MVGLVSAFLLLLPSTYGILVRQDCDNYADNCTTLQACLQNISYCFRNGSILDFGPGVHEVPAEEIVFYIISNLSNIVLKTETNATIDCLNHRASFAFININNLTMKGITFQKCGVNLRSVIDRINDTCSCSLALTFHKNQSISLLLANVYNLTMEHAGVQNGSGIGMAGINVFGTSRIHYCRFEGNNIGIISDIIITDLDCSKEEEQPKCNGGNAVFLYTDILESMISETRLEIENSLFYQGMSYINNDFSQISYNPVADKYLIAAGGLSVVLTQSVYSVTINIINATCTENMGFKGANLYIIVYSGVTLSKIMIMGGKMLKSNVLYGLSPKLNGFSTQSVGGGIYYEYGRQFENLQQSQLKNGSKHEIVDIRIIGTYIASNQAQTGGGMAVRFHLQPNSIIPFQHRMWLQNVTFQNNSGYFGAAFYLTETQFQQVLNIAGYKVQYNKVFNTTLLHVTIQQSRSHIFGLDSGFGSAVCFNGASVILIQDALIQENDCTGILVINTQLSVANVTIYKNHALAGGGIVLLSQSILFLQPNNTILNISHNQADNYGGGIYIPLLNYADISPLCFFQVYPKTEVPWVTSIDQYNATVVLENNTARIGHEIYGGDLDNCYLMYLDWKSHTAFKKFVQVNYTNGSSDITSDPYTICFCENNQSMCHSSNFDVSAYPGQAFEISTVAVGQLQGITDRKYLATLPTAQFRNDLVVTILKSNHSCGNTGDDANCSNTTFKIETSCTSQSRHHSVDFYIFIYGQIQQYYWKTVKVHIEPCPLFYGQFKDKKQCTCMDILEDKHIQCYPEVGNIVKPAGNVYVGYQNNCTYIHDHCPFDYCNIESKTLFGNSQNSQCINNRGGLLCGECQPGYSVMFGSNRCQRCSNTYLLLLIPFAAAGIVLVWVVCYFNLTVSTGTLNGLIFYANIVHINKAILYPNRHDLLTVFIDWLNLDLGINTCFYNGLDSYVKSFLQFAFPAYIWMLSLLTIYLSRHLPIVYRVLGEHSTKALATLLLLSFNKIINNVAAAFSMTDLQYQCEDGRRGTLLVWSKEASIAFLGEKHLILIAFEMLCLVLLILPFVGLLLFSPNLLRKTHYPCLHWMIRLKPFIDAYHGPYNVRWRCWSGILLVVRGGLLVAFILNRKGSPHLQLLFITLTAVSLLPVVVYGNGIYRNRIMNVCEAVAIGNLAVYSATAQFCLTQGKECQVIASDVFLSIALGQLTIIVLTYGGLKFRGFWQTNVRARIPDADSLKRMLWHYRHSNNAQCEYETITGQNIPASEAATDQSRGWNEDEDYREPLLSMT